MIEHFTVFHRGGIVLWQHRAGSVMGNKRGPVNQLISTVLLEERGGEDTFSDENLQMKWKQENDFGLIFVCVYQKVLQLLYIDELLEKVRRKFVAMFKDSLAPVDHGFDFEFEEAFLSIQRKLESADAVKSKGVSSSFEDTQRWTKTKAGQDKFMHNIDAAPKKGKKGKKAASESESESSGEDELEAESDDEEAQERRRLAIEKLKQNSGKKGRKGGATSPGRSPRSPATTSPSKKKHVKEARSWAGAGARTRAEKDALDFSGGGGEEGDGGAAMAAHRAKLYGEAGEVDIDAWIGDESSSDEEDVAEGGGKKKSSGMFSMFTNLVGGKILDRDDLEPTLRQVRESLVEKNVAVEIADKLCESVCASLVGKKLESWTGVKATVKQSLESALTRILTPKQSIDIVADITNVTRGQKRPYVMVFCGVNGVGKSTTLAKVCNWLLGNNLTVLIAACDTFRAGAVEQLKVHSRALGVDVYDKGYGKDAAAIAQEAIREAGKAGTDVVLVDTAGRMQDNMPLMRALAKLVAVNSPDLCLFVGEALVGNDSVDQLKKFNQALADSAMHVAGQTLRKQYIDGIVLTKFDTVDDKVGAALSMVYETGQPIVFVGVGQTYKDIRKMNIKHIVKLLCK